MTLQSLNTKIYNIQHLTQRDKPDISKFIICNPKGKGLERYLKAFALDEEKESNARTYLIRDNATNEIAAYFSLKTGLVTYKTSLISFDNRTGIELANFAVNDAYREYADVVPQLGRYVFSTFVLPLVSEISKYVGAQYLYIFALPEEKLMSHYATMGFARVSDAKYEQFIHSHIRPTYDKGCIFMFQKIRQLSVSL